MNLERFESLLAQSGLDAVIASSLENVSYLSGARIVMQRLIPDRLALLLWPGHGDPAIVVCKGEDVACRDDCRISDMRAYTEFVTSPIDLLAEVVIEKGLANGRLGLEMHSLPSGYVNQLRTRIPEATLVDCGDLMDRARMIKTPEEVDTLAAAGRFTERAIRRAFERATSGEPEKKVADDITAGVTAAGADVLNFMFLGTGTRSFEWHARPGPTRLQAGHVVHTDVAGNFVGYWSDLARTAFVGKPSPRRLDIYRRLYQAHVDTLDAIRPGLEVRELYSACQAAYRRVGLPFQMAHIGHGLGLGLHEYPMLKPTTDEPLQPGMVLCIEPAYLDPGVAGYHIEDLVLVTEQGREVLTDYEGAHDAQVIT